MEITSKNMVDKALESRGGIHQSKWHHYILLVTPFGLECHLELMPRFNLHLVVHIPQINSRENLHACERIHNIIYLGQWELI